MQDLIISNPLDRIQRAGAVWKISTSGHLTITDNLYDIGQAGATRPRNIYIAGLATIGGGMNLSGGAGSSFNMNATTGLTVLTGPHSGANISGYLEFYTDDNNPTVNLQGPKTATSGTIPPQIIYTSTGGIHLIPGNAAAGALPDLGGSLILDSPGTATIYSTASLHFLLDWPGAGQSKGTVGVWTAPVGRFGITTNIDSTNANAAEGVGIAGGNFLATRKVADSLGSPSTSGVLAQVATSGAITMVWGAAFQALNASLGGGAITNQAAFYAPALSGATNNYLLYGAGAGKVSIGDNLTIRASGLTVASGGASITGGLTALGTVASFGKAAGNPGFASIHVDTQGDALTGLGAGTITVGIFQDNVNSLNLTGQSGIVYANRLLGFNAATTGAPTISNAATLAVDMPTASASGAILTQRSSILTGIANIASINNTATTQYRVIRSQDHSVSLANTTQVTSTPAFTMLSLGQLTINQLAGATIVDNVATAYIKGPPIAGGSVTLTNLYSIWVDAGNSRFDGNLDLSAGAANLILDATTGTKFGTATSQKLAFWNKAPIIQPTTGIAAAAFVANTSGIANDTATFGGYTIGQIAAALVNSGILA